MKSQFYLIILAIITAVSLVTFSLVLKLRPRKINVNSCTVRWQAIQKLCSNKKEWYLAIIEADRLLDDVLKRRHYKGKTTGERLVSAQHDFTNNESLWFGHKLYNRIHDEDLKKLRKQDTLEALGGFRQALKDLGALRDKVITAPAKTEAQTVIVEPAKPQRAKKKAV